MDQSDFRQFIHDSALIYEKPSLDYYNELKWLPFKDRLRRLWRYKLIGGFCVFEMGMSVDSDEYLGNGGEHVVYFSQDKAKKIVWTSLSKDRTQLEGQLSHFNHQEQIGRTYMGKHWIPTSYEVKKVLFGKSAIVSEQPKLEHGWTFDNTDWLLDFAKEINSPKLNHAIRSFSASARRLNANTGLYPDILGPNNLTIFFEDHEGSPPFGLAILDTILVDQAKQQEPSLEDCNITRGELIDRKLRELELYASD